MEKKTITQITTEVRGLTQFEQKKETLEEMVKMSKETINFSDPTKEQLVVVKSKRLEIRKVEKVIEDKGIEFRGIFKRVNEQIMEKQRELTGITSPEIERLAKIESDAAKKEEMRKKEILLPTRIMRLKEISSKRPVSYPKEKLLELNSVEFENLYNECVSNENDCVRMEMEEKQRAEDDKRREEVASLEAKLAQERATIEADRQAVENEKNAAQKAIEDVQKQQQDKIDEAKRKIEVERVRLDHQKEMQEAKVSADLKAKEDIERENKQKEEALAARIKLDESRVLYKKFMAEKGWTEKTRNDYESRLVNGGYELWHRIGKFNVK